jgi:hypothetical protein
MSANSKSLKMAVRTERPREEPRRLVEIGLKTNGK